MRISDEVVMKHYLYQQLWEQFEELCSYASDVASHCDEMTGEMKYLCDFIEYQGLEEEYRYFREHAHLDETDKVPFPSYTL